ncbi:MAG: AraC family transcriptional regulator [Treponema sp.]|nr:AraC family transcriptional regulator [Treponema sp.]
MDTTNRFLTETLIDLVPKPGYFETGIQGLAIARHDEPTGIIQRFYSPMVILLVQGKKLSIIGTEEVVWGKNKYMLIGADLPSGGRILTATPKKPFLKIIMRLDTSILLELLAEIPFPATERTGETAPRQGIAVVDTDPYLLDAFLRLTELLKPELKSTAEHTVLAPLIIRELHYRLLQGPLGSRLRMIHTQGSKNYQIAQAILWLKNNYTKPLHINELAKLVSMAPSTFMRQFLQLTTISPLQYQKRLRLHEAQQLMLTERIDAAHAAYSVGYESMNQFNREYKRLFGEPPKKNIKRLLAG